MSRQLVGRKDAPAPIPVRIEFAAGDRQLIVEAGGTREQVSEWALALWDKFDKRPVPGPAQSALVLSTAGFTTDLASAPGFACPEDQNRTSP